MPFIEDQTCEHTIINYAAGRVLCKISWIGGSVNVSDPCPDCIQLIPFDEYLTDYSGTSKAGALIHFKILKVQEALYLSVRTAWLLTRCSHPNKGGGGGGGVMASWSQN